MTKQTSLADRLRKAIRDSGMTLFEIGKATDIYPSTISRFLNRETSLNLENAERIMGFLGFQVVRNPKKKRR